MIIDSVTITSNQDARVAWSSIQRFQNVPEVKDKIVQLHSLGSRDASNAQKQARQLRYCLIQAREYFNASQIVSLATRPTLLYYSMMSLALAEILLKQEGDSSLDRARQVHRHHGLIFGDTGAAKPTANLQTAAAALTARPMVQENDNRIGTFELWHRSSRPTPLVGKQSERHNSGGLSNSYTVLGIAKDERPTLLPPKGVTLLDCLIRIPLMLDYLQSYGISSRIVRGKLAKNISPGGETSQFKLTVHPDPFANELLDHVKMHPSLIDQVGITEFPRGGIFDIHVGATDPVPFLEFPEGVSQNAEELLFWVDQNLALNEFGFLYVALFIAGNYARYYPDKWVHDVENSTPLALAIEELLSVAERRMVWLTLSELSRSYQVLKAP
jgi:hypothetical protein